MVDQHQAAQTRLLAIIAFLLVGFALCQTYAVTMPLAAAAVVIAAVWPVKPWLERFFPATLANIGTVLVLFVVLAAFAGAISFSVARVAQAFTELRQAPTALPKPFRLGPKLGRLDRQRRKFQPCDRHGGKGARCARLT